MQFSVDLEALSGGPVCTWEEKAMPGFEAAAKKAIAGACAAVLKAEADLTRWDQIVGDGDCGITQKRGAEKVMEMLGNGGLNAAKPAQMMNDLAEAVGKSMGGTSGVLFEIFFRKCAEELKLCQSGGANEVTEAGEKGMGPPLAQAQDLASLHLLTHFSRFIQLYAPRSSLGSRRLRQAAERVSGRGR